MSERQVIVRSRRLRARAATVSSIVRAHAPAADHVGRGALLSGTAFAALVACGLFGFNDRALAQPSVQLPTDPNVVAGSATVTQTGTSQLTVTQTTDRGVIDWRSFSIGSGARVDFIQPGRTSVTLNRVTGPDPSIIAGQLNANGQIVLVNQAGVMFTGGAQVNVESLIASTANVANPQAFMAGGRIAFDQAGANPNARVVNDGTITVRDGGLVALLGPSAANNGVINARLGRVTVGGAETFTVDLNGDGLVNFAIGNPVSQTPRDADGKALALASNTGTINADGGQVAITAAAARAVVDGVVNVGGRINARSVTNEGGVIVFGGGESTQVNVTGTIDVSGGTTQKGGTVTVTASKVNVASTARINANGGAGGGTVLVGGGKQGQGPIANARTTTVATGALITADATDKGNGGTVIVWADNTTVFGGTINARGGSQGGDGGFAEVSGKKYLDYQGLTDLRATSGAWGTLLLDPSDIEITVATNQNVTGGTPFQGTAATSKLSAATIVTALLTADVEVDASAGASGGTGSITVNAPIVSVSGKSLTFTALANIAINDTVNVGAGNFTATTSGGAITGSGAITAAALSLNAGGLINLTGEMAVTTVNFVAGGAVTINNSTNDIINIATVASTAGGNVEIFSTETTTIAAGGIDAGTKAIKISTDANNDNLVLTGSLTGGSITLIAGDTLSGAGSIVASGTIALTAANGGDINLTGVITGTGLTVTSPGAVTLTNSDNVFNTLSASGAIGGAVNIVHKGALSVGAVNTGSKALTLTTKNSGDLTVTGTLTSSGGLTLNAAGALAINAAVNAGTGDVFLGGSSIGQNATGVITAAGVSVTSTGAVDLTAASNVFSKLAGSADSLGLIVSGALSIGTVNGIDPLTVTNTLQVQAGGDITQTQSITADAAAFRSTAGSVNLTGATNDFTTFAASATVAIGLLEANGVQVDQIAAVGSLAALKGITASLGAGLRTLAGSVTQTVDGVIAGGTGGLSVSVTGGNIVLDTAENATKLVAFSSPGTASYKTSTDINVGQVGALGNNPAIDGATATTSLSLATTGAATTITQAKLVSTGTLTLATGASGQITLTDSDNLIGTVQGSGTWGTAAHTISDSAGGLSVGAITSSGDVALTTAGGGLTITAAVDVGAKTLALRANGNNAITATAAAVTAGTLTLETGTGGSASIQTVAHNVGTIATAGSGVGSGGIVFQQERAGGTTVGPITSTGIVLINDGVGAITVSGAITVTNNNLTLAASANKLNINAQIDVGNGQVALLAQGDITQANAGAGITADSLRGQSTAGNVLLAPTGVPAADVNTVNRFAAISSAGSVSFRNSGTFNVGLVNATQGINAATSVTLQVNAAGGTITQTAGADGAIITPTLNLTTNGGDVTIDSVSNNVAALGTVNLGTGALTFSTARAGGFNVGAVTANGGIDITNTAGDLTTSAAIVSDGTISLRSTTGALTLGGTVTSNNNGITLQSNNALNTGAFLVSAPTAVAGDVTLISDASTVTIGVGGVTVGDTLTVQIGPGLPLNVSGAINGATSVALHADAIEISAAINATDTITLAPVTVGTATTIGGAAAAGFVIDNTELTFLTSASTLTIGKQSTGTVTSGAITVATATVGSATLNLFTTAGISQIGPLTVGGGTGTLNLTAAGTVNLNGSGANVGTLNGSTTSGNFAVVRQSGVAGDLSVGGITTAGGEISVRNFAGNLDIDGALISNGGNILAGTNNSNFALNLNANVDAGTGAIALFSSTGGITQSTGKLVGVNLVATVFGTTGSVSLASATNAVTGNVSLNAGSTSGDITFSDSSSYIVGGITGVSYAIFGGLSLDVAIGPGMRAPGGTVTLNVADTVTQAAGATDLVSASTLSVVRIGATNPSVTLDNANNAVTNLGLVTLGTGSLTLVDGSSGLAIAGNVGVDSLSITTSGGSLSQNGGTTITANSVTANAPTGGFTGVFLNSATNAISAISGSAAGLFGFGATTTTTLTANAITAASGIALTTTGANSDLSVNGLLSAASGTVTLTAGRDISQTAIGGIASSSLQANATSGSVDLTAGAANNSVSTIAGQSSGNFLYTDANTAALTIGTVSTAGITSTTGGIAVKATKTAATLMVSQNVTASASGGNVTLESVGDLTINGATTITANGTNGRVSLTSSAGSITEAGTSSIAAAELLASAQTNIDLRRTSNVVGAKGFAANATTGFVAFFNNGAIELDQVGGINGITAGDSVLLATLTGDLTQTANGIITAGAGLLLQAIDGNIVFNQSNQVTGNFAVVGTANGDVTLRNTGDISVGSVSTPSGTFSGISIGTKTLTLTSDTGVITQGVGAGDAIIVGELRVNTTDQNVTLTNTSNQLTSIGNSNLGAGRLTVVDGALDLTVSNPVTADGGVILTTQTTFNLPGSITVANGDISLTSVTGGIALSSALSAANGQVQLDAGGAGTITQTAAGTITALTLIARAPGSVTLSGDNDVGTVAGSSTSGSFTYRDLTAVTIGSLTDSTVATVSGITTTNQDVTIVAGAGGATGGIAVNQAVNSGASGVVRLLTSKGDITQAATGLITANSLLANAAAGSVNLAAVANAVVFVAGKSGGSFRLLTANATGVSDVTADGAALTTASSGITSNGDMAIQTAGNLVLLSALDAGTGTMRLRTTAAGQVIQAAAGTITADALLIDATGAVTLTASANNDVNTLAGRTTSGVFKFQDKNGFTVGTIGADGLGLDPFLPIGPLTGVTTAGGDITLAAAGGQLTLAQAVNAGFGSGTIRLYTGSGDLTQGVNGTLTGGSLLAVSAGGMVNLTGATNTVSGIAGTAATSFLFQNQVGFAVSNVAFTGEGVVPAATGITGNTSGAAGGFVVDLAVASGTLAINGPVSSANGMIVYRRTPTGTAGAIDVGGGAGNAGNNIGTTKLVVVDLTGASPVALYGATPGAGPGGLFNVATPATGFSPLGAFGSLTGGTATVGELSGLNSTVYFFANAATIQSTGGGGATFGLLGVYGQNNTVNLTTTVRVIDPNLVRAITTPFTEPTTTGPTAAFYVRHDGLATATEQFNACPIGTINCVVFTTPIAAPSVSADDVVIGVAAAPLDDSGIVLVNQGNEDLIIENDEDRKKDDDDKKPKGGTPQ